MRKGSSIVEFAFLAPWFVFLAAGILDLGFYNYALITAQDAARTAALYTSGSQRASTDAAGACADVYDQLTSNINLTGETGCNGAISLTAVASVGPDGLPSSTVTVRFSSATLIPIPGLLPASIQVERSVQMLVGR